MIRPIRAERVIVTFPFDWYPQHSHTPAHVEEIMAHLKAGGSVPPVILARYSGSYMPLDGHHRTDAHYQLGRDLDAYVVDGPRFERLDRRLREAGVAGKIAEDYILCDGVLCMQVAQRWDEEQGPHFSKKLLTASRWCAT